MKLTPEQRATLDALRKLEQPATTQQVADALDLSRNCVARRLQLLERRGKVICVAGPGNFYSWSVRS